MTQFDDIRQKAEGRLDQIRGEIKQQSGDDIGGAWDKFRGDVKEGIADIKMQMRAENDDDDEDKTDDRT